MKESSNERRDHDRGGIIYVSRLSPALPRNLCESWFRVGRWLRGGISVPVPDENVLALIADAYRGGMSTKQVAAMFSLNYSAARKAILASGVSMRSSEDGTRLAFSQGRVSRENTPGWSMNAVRASAAARSEKARGKSVKPSGYVEFTTGDNKFRTEHVVVMEESIGRRIRPGEQVHHIDGDKRNNMLSNLVLMSRSDHARLHALERSPLRTRDALGRYSGGKIS